MNSKTTTYQNAPLVLIIDDDKVMRLLTTSLLKAEGYRVAEAEDGAQGLSLYDRLQPDIVLLDVTMPLMDGFETCTRLRALPNGDHALVLMVTALEDKSSVNEAFEAGANDYVTKPIHPSVLFQRLRSLLRAKQAEDALRESEKKYRSVVESVREVIFQTDAAGLWTFLNPAWTEITGFTLAKSLGQNFLNFIHPDDRQHNLELFQPLIEGKKEYCRHEIRYLVKEGSERSKQVGDFCWIEVQARLTLGANGEITGTTGMLNDITERKRTEEALKTQAKVLENMVEGVNVSDESGIIFFTNPAFDMMFGYEPGELIGRHVSVLNTDSSEETVRLNEEIMAQSQVHGYWAGEFNNRKKNGEIFTTSASISALEIGDRRCLISVQEDTTERKQMQAKMLESQKLVSLGTLSAGVAHELNSPLQVITGVSQSLLNHLNQGPLDPDFLSRKLETIHRNGWRCAEITRSLRTYAHASTDQFAPNDLNALVHDSLLLIEHQLKSWANITISTKLDPDLPPLLCDQNQITQILINLLTNARDAMSEGGEIIIRTGYEPQSSQIILAVADSGAGMPEHVQAKIFDPFFTTKPLGQGTGLGLSIVSGIIRAYGGKIEVISSPGRGTIFAFFFPQSLVSTISSLPLIEHRFDTSSLPEYSGTDGIMVSYPLEAHASR